MISSIEMKLDVLSPQQCKGLVSASPSTTDTTQDVWCYRFTTPSQPWTLAIATLGSPQSGKLSLGGFRIVPEERAAIPNFSPEREAIGLALGMEEKVFWSRHLKVGGEYGLRNLSRIVGGKCVLLPSKGSRVGETNDFKLLDFALTCLNRFEEESGVSVTTGQDLGHGVMSDGKTTSLEYMSSRFHGCINADTSKPTGEGNFRMLEGCLRGSGISTDRARVLLIGYGNIGFHLADRLKSLGTQIEVVEPSEKRAKQAIEKGFKVHSIDEVAKLLADSFDAVALNANGNSLTSERVAAICNNNQLKIICGCENLVFAADANETPFTRARKIFTPTEMCGMMGYLTAVEEYLRTQARSSFSIDEMYTPAKRLEEVGYSAAKSFWGSMQSFEQCVRAL